MSQDQSIPRRNKVDWHMDNDDPILTTMRFIPQHEVVQKYDAILPDYLTNLAMKESEAYKTYHALTTGKVQPKPKYVCRSSRTTTDQAPKASPGKRLKETAKATNSHDSGSGANEGTGVKQGVPDVPTYDSEDEQISWKSSSDEDDIDDDDHDDDADNDRERHDDEEDKDEEDKDEETFDPRVQTPSHYETSDDKAYIEVAQGANAEEEKMEEEKTNKEDEATNMYRDVNINLEGRDTEMTDTPHPIVQTTQVIEDTHLTLTLVNPEGQQQSSSVSFGFISNMFNPNPDTGIDFVLNVETTFLVDVPVTTQAKIPPTSATTLPPLPLPLITSTTNTCPHNNNWSQFLSTKSSNFWLSIRLKDAVDVAIQLKSDKIGDKAQAENEDFLNKIDDNIKELITKQVKAQVKKQVSKILPRIEKLVNEHLEAELLTRSSNEA
ncbi:hypothetical protein Tco_0561285 [Tanacetum coccineum]